MQTTTQDSTKEAARRCHIAGRAHLILEIAERIAKTDAARDRIEEMQLHHEGYAEPGYSDPDSGLIATGNWNTITKWNETTHDFDTLDNTPKRVAELFEKLGIEIEWSDEWNECRECHKLIRTQPDGYDWTPAYYLANGYEICHECVKANPADYLESLEGSATRCETIGLDLSEHGYELRQDKYENGFHPGQNDNPKEIAAQLRAQGIRNFIFQLDYNSQFTTGFSVWVKVDEESNDED